MSAIDLGASTAMPRPELVFRLAIRADIGPPVEFETTYGTVRSVFPITGGAMLGEGLEGKILPGGADFAQLLPDGSYAVAAK